MLIKAYFGHKGRKGRGSSKRNNSPTAYNVISSGLADIEVARNFMQSVIDNPLTSEQNNALKKYTGSGYHKKVRSAIMGNIPMTDELTADIQNLDESFSQTSLKEDIKLFRGVDSNHPISKQFDSLQGGEILQDVSFQSTSLNRQTASGFTTDKDDFWNDSTGIIINILAPKGSKVLPILHGSMSHEQEMLLPRNSLFKITEIDKTNREITVIII